MAVSAIPERKEFLRLHRVLAFGVILLVAGLFFYACVPLPPQKFSSERWLSGGTKSRGTMVENLINQKVLIGKTEPEVTAILGKPDEMIPEQNCFTYVVKTNLRCTALWKCGLLVYFDAQTKQVNYVTQTD